VFVPSYTMF